MTPAQLDAIKADIAANPDLAAFPQTQDGADGVAQLYNAFDATFKVWNTAAPTDAIFDAVDWTKYTPNMKPLVGDIPARAAFIMNNALLTNIKQMNLQNMLFGRQSIDGSKLGIRKGLQDSVTGVPAGAAGADVDPGGALGVTVVTALVRPARRIEKLLVTSTPTTGGVTAGLMGFEGQVSYPDIVAARARP